MNDYQKSYYQKMLEKDRLVPIVMGDKLVGFITYYIGSVSEKYVRDDPWSVLEDNTDGSVCFVDQLITDKNKENIKFSRTVFKNFKNHIATKYPKVHVIRWNRVKRGVPHVFYKSIER